MASSKAQFGLARPFDVLLDETFVAELLRLEALSTTPFADVLADVRVERVWPVRHSTVVIEWSFALDSAPRQSLYGIVAGNEGDKPFVTTSSSPSDGESPRIESGILHGVHAELPRLGLTVLSPDRDPILAHLADCLNVCTAVKRLRGGDFVGGSDFGVMGLRSCRLLGYRLGRRATIGYETVGWDGAVSRVIGKMFRDDRGRTVLERLAFLRAALSKISRDRVQVPEPLTYLSDCKMAICSAVPDPSDVTDDTDNYCPPAAFEAMAALHRVPVLGLTPFTPADERRVLRRWHALLELVATSLPRSMVELANGLAEIVMSAVRSEIRLIHRDFYRAQLLLGQDTCSILDLDTLAVGDPHVDVGNLIAHTLLERLQAGGDAEEWEAISQRAGDLYRHHGGLIRAENLGYYTATSLFRLGAVHALRTRTGRFAPQLWEAGAQAMRRGLPQTPAGREHSTVHPVVCGDVVPQEVGS